MSNTYDYDLRRKVIDAIELESMPRSEASRVFNVSRNTIHSWFKLKAETGDLHPKTLQPQGPVHRIKDWDKFRTFVESNPDKTQKELAQLWEGNISARTVSRALKHIGFTRKKRPMATVNGISKNERYSSPNLQPSSPNKLSMQMNRVWIIGMNTSTVIVPKENAYMR